MESENIGLLYIQLVDTRIHISLLQEWSKAKERDYFLVVNERNEVLLIKIEDKLVSSVSNKNPVKWITSGRKIDESLESATVRELEEEIGIRGANFSPLLWFERHELNWKGIATKIQDNFFMVRVEAQLIPSSNLTDEERLIYKGYKWWSLDELENTEENVIPEKLVQMLKCIIAGNLPSPPLDIAGMPSGKEAQIGRFLY